MKNNLCIILLILALSNTVLAQDIKKHTALNGLFIHDYPIEIPEEIYFLDQKGNKQGLGAYEGKVVILHFWASWCTYCVNEMIELDRFRKHIRGKPVRVIPISEDSKGVSHAEKFYLSHGIKFLELYMDDKSKLFKELKIIGLPTTIFINQRGKEIGRCKGVVDWKSDSIKKIIDNFSIDAKNDDEDSILKEISYGNKNDSKAKITTEKVVDD